MKRFLFYLKNALEQLWKEKRCSAILILSATVTFTAMIVLFQISFANADTLEELQVSRRTYQAQFTDPENAEAAAASKEVWHWLTEGEELPEITKVSGLQGISAGYILTSFWEDGIEQFRAEQWNFFAADETTESMEDFKVTEGRYFLPEELDAGSNVILLSETICEMDELPYQVGDTLVLNEVSYEIVGFASGIKHYMPLKTVLQVDNMGILFSSVQFSDVLTGKEEAAFYEKMNAVCQTVECQYDTKMEELGRQIISYLISSLLLLGICVITLARILRYLWYSKRHEYAIYRQCGATKGQTRWILCLQIVSFCLISAVLAIGAYQLFIPVLEYYQIGQ